MLSADGDNGGRVDNERNGGKNSGDDHVQVAHGNLEVAAKAGLDMVLRSAAWPRAGRLLGDEDAPGKVGRRGTPHRMAIEAQEALFVDHLGDRTGDVGTVTKQQQRPVAKA